MCGLLYNMLLFIRDVHGVLAFRYDLCMGGFLFVTVADIRLIVKSKRHFETQYNDIVDLMKWCLGVMFIYEMFSRVHIRYPDASGGAVPRPCSISATALYVPRSLS